MFKATYIVEVCVVDRGLLDTNVEDDEDGMYQITSKANVGNWDPETWWQEALDKTWIMRGTKKNMKMWETWVVFI